MSSMLRIVCVIMFLHLFSSTSAQSGLSKADRLYNEANALLERIYEDTTVGRQILSKYTEAQRLYELNSNIDKNYADLFRGLGAYYETKLSFGEATKNYRQSVVVWQKLRPSSERDIGLFKTYTLLCQAYFKTEKNDSAIYFGKLAENMPKPMAKSDAASRLFNVIGAIFHSVGDYRQSKLYLEKAFNAASKQKPARPDLLGNFLINIGTAAYRLNDYLEALKAYRQALTYNYLPEVIYRKIGQTYLSLNKLDSAALYLEKAALPDNPANRVETYKHLGDLYLRRGEYTKALDYFNQSIVLNQQQPGRKKTLLAGAQIGIGQVYEVQGRFLQALSSYQTALQTLHFTFRDANVYHNPKEAENVVSRLDFFRVLRRKASALRQYHARTRNRRDLDIALQTYQLAIGLAESLRLGYDSDEAKLFFSQQVFPVYEEAVSAAFGLFAQTGQAAYAEQAFGLSEKSKAAVLSETLRGVQIRQQPGLPADLLQQERDLRRQITRLTVKGLDNLDSAQAAKLRDQVRDQEIALSQLMRKLDANEKYFRLKYQPQPVSLARLQQNLDKNTALVEYFYGDSAVFAFVVTHNSFQAVRLPTDATFYDALGRYKTSLFEHHFSPQQPFWANTLYKILIKPLKTALDGYDKLVIVPDGALCYLPFESLVEDPAHARYLLDDYVIRYAYSGTLLDYARRGGIGDLERDVLAMAPFAGESGSRFRSVQISPLPASKGEVERIGGRIFLESSATKEVFLKMAARHGVIHLATHANADSREPLNSYITFYPQNTDSVAGYRLYTAELYNLRLDSVKLVVLSACETGGGQLVRGEGVMSLARAFAYAGSPNIVMTLWRAEDQATAQITTRMYEYLRQGYDKDEALTRSKRDYLREAPATRRNPYFWANAVLVGDDAPVYTSLRWWWLIGGAAVLLAAAAWLLWRIYRKPRHKTATVRKFSPHE